MHFFQISDYEYSSDFGKNYTVAVSFSFEQCALLFAIMELRVT